MSAWREIWQISFIVIFISETFHNRFVSRDPPSSSAQVKVKVELYLYSPSGPSWPVLGWSLPLPLREHGVNLQRDILIRKFMCWTQRKYTKRARSYTNTQSKFILLESCEGFYSFSVLEAKCTKRQAIFQATTTYSKASFRIVFVKNHNKQTPQSRSLLEEVTAVQQAKKLQVWNLKVHSRSH